MIRCAELLRERGLRIVGIVSQAPGVRAWALQQDIPALDRTEYGAVLDSESIDVLLSITHPALIPPAHLRKVRLAAINYHDGPLPRYAGMNGSTWALMNGEVRHAIVWHHLTAGLDEGDVLEREDIDLHPRETSVSLNMGNSVRALESFKRVLDRIERRDLAGVPQRRDLDRTVFSRHDRPGAMCLIDWSRSAEELDRLVRACEFGAYANRFGSAKLIHDGRAVIVREAIPEPTAGSGTPGTVLGVDDGIVINAARGALRLRRFTTLSGEPLTSAQAVAALRLRAGDVVESPFARDAATAALSTELARAEPRFVAALTRRLLPSLPFASAALTAASPSPTVQVDLPAAFRHRFGEDLPAAVGALFTFTLSCVVREDKFDVAFVDAAARTRGALGAARALLSASIPLRVDIDTARGFDVHVDQFRLAIAQSDRAPAFLTDLLARHPSLREQPDLRAGKISPVAIVTGGGPAPPGAQVALVIGDGPDVTRPIALSSDGSATRAALEALVHQMASVAVKVALDAARPLAVVDALDDVERTRQVTAWNATAAPFPDTLRIHDLFEAQVAERPDATALVFEGAALTFRALEARANRIANALQARGVRPGEYVALLVERGFDLVATLIGVAKSGAAYLPIDPNYPEDRARFMLEDAGCRCVIASPDLAPLLGADAAGPGSGRVLFVNGDEISGASEARPPCPSTSADVCYAIYTSGSTGRPKGVVLTHRAVVNTLDWVNRQLAVGPADRLLFVTSPSFDLSVYDVFGALGAGACVDVASAALLREPADLARHVVERGITIWDSAPPALARLATFFPDSAPLSQLRLVMLSGDWIPVWLPDHIRRIFPRAQVTSLGGATEAAIWSNYFHVGEVDPRWPSIPYGTPIQNARYYILDAHLRPVPALIPGDLYIAGTCLAEGYLNREELTAERFIADPFHPGERMYKTGDLARYGADGIMEFLGRADFQVKIRGFRVELGEVEAAVRALPNVRDAVCSTWVDGAQQKALVAYVVGLTARPLDGKAIKEKLAARLPDFMVPSFVVPIAALPLSSNGKLDRKALPSPMEAGSGTAYQAPRTPTEEAMAAIWQDVLQRNPIGVRDNFFEIGGHSLLAVVLINRLKERFKVQVPLSQIIEAPTIEALAASLAFPPVSTSAGDGKPTARSVELRPGGPGRIFFVHDGDGETLLYRTLALRLPPGFAVFGLAPRSLPGIPLAETRIEQMAASYVAEVRRRQPHGPYHLAGLCAGGVIAFEMALQLERAGERVEMVAILDAAEPRTLTRPVVASRRLARLQGLFAGRSPTPSARGAYRIASQVLRRARNAAEFEVTQRVRDVSSAARFKLLERVLESGNPWPRRVPPMRVRDIYLAAKSRYFPSVLSSGRVLVLKATEGADADEPLIYQIADRFLGWGRVVNTQIEAIDIPGGHSSMLRAPNVDVLAEHLARVLVR